MPKPITSAADRVAIWHLANSDVHFEWQPPIDSDGYVLTVQDPSGAWRTVPLLPRGQSVWGG